jgi:predicted murein hydrolase (TIGR00659 family)
MTTTLFLGLIVNSATIVVFLLARKLYRLKPSVLLLPLIVTTVLTVIVLMLTDYSYENYVDLTNVLSGLLGPAVVALAYPLYRQLPLIKVYLRPLSISLLIGAVAGVVSGWGLGVLFGLNDEFLAPLLTKSVTAPVAMDIAAIIEGNQTLAAILVTVAGLTGAVLASSLFKWTKIDHVIGRGLGYGIGSHAIGTARALDNSEFEGAISSVAMTVCAVIVSLVAPLFAMIVF